MDKQSRNLLLFHSLYCRIRRFKALYSDFCQLCLLLCLFLTFFLRQTANLFSLPGLTDNLPGRLCSDNLKTTQKEGTNLGGASMRLYPPYLMWLHIFTWILCVS